MPARRSIRPQNLDYTTQGVITRSKHGLVWKTGLSTRRKVLMDTANQLLYVNIGGRRATVAYLNVGR